MKWVLVRPSSFRLPRYNLVRKRVTDSKFFFRYSILMVLIGLFILYKLFRKYEISRDWQKPISNGLLGLVIIYRWERDGGFCGTKRWTVGTSGALVFTMSSWHNQIPPTPPFQVINNDVSLSLFHKNRSQLFWQSDNLVLSAELII